MDQDTLALGMNSAVGRPNEEGNNTDGGDVQDIIREIILYMLKGKRRGGALSWKN